MKYRDRGIDPAMDTLPTDIAVSFALDDRRIAELSE